MKKEFNWKLVTTEFNAESTIGELYCDGVKICDTLEDTYRKLPKTCPNTSRGGMCGCKEKVFGKTCIPEGKYSVIYRYSPKFKKYYPAIQEVPHFLGILIHAGSTHQHTEGCILVGTRVSGKEALTDQFQTSARVKKMVEEQVKKGDVYITIER